MKIGSLFDGSGGFPLAGTKCGFTPVWASEIEPYPIAVTSSRFPNMKHLGDISKVHGANIEPVDIITFGSPCQDLSVAGKRAGLKHEENGDDETTRSGLFMEAVRIIKEMRGATNGEYPRFAVWENVPGAFSSNNGEDFRIVLQELIKVTEPKAVMPEVPKSGWAYADSYSGDGWSLAYRVFDAQYWGVPQRRRRIYLVADFRGECAEKILFEREGLRGYFEESGTQGQTVTSDVEGSIGADDREGAFGFDTYNMTPVGDKTVTLRAGSEHNYAPVFQPIAYGISSYDSNSMKSSNPHSGIYEADTSRTLDGNGGNPSCNQGGIAVVQGFDGYNATETGDKSATLGVNCGMSTGRNGVITLEPGIAAREGGHIYEDVSGTLRANMGDNQMAVAYGVTTKGNGDAFLSEERHTTLSVGGGQAGQGYPCVCYGVDAYNQSLTGDKAKTLNSAASDADHIPCTVYSVENHPADSRVNLDESGKVQTLTSRMGTGGGNVPMVMEERPSVINLNKNDVQSKTILDPSGIAPALYAGECRGGGGECYVMEPFCKSRRAQSADDATTWKYAKVANTLNTFDQGEARANEIIVMATQQGGAEIAHNLCPTITAAAGMSGNNQPVAAYGHHDGVVISRPIHSMTTGDYMQVNEEKTATLLARDYKDPTCVEFYDETSRSYIVRRLTPTECARLQGFPDEWGHIEPKTKLTDDEYRFWGDVRKTHDAINGKAVKDYNAKQMLTWYNKLWTDSSEYKMWGNGIALPCALYVMQGIKESLVDEQSPRSNWLDDFLRRWSEK